MTKAKGDLLVGKTDIRNSIANAHGEHLSNDKAHAQLKHTQNEKNTIVDALNDELFIEDFDYIHKEYSQPQNQHTDQSVPKDISIFDTLFEDPGFDHIIKPDPIIEQPRSAVEPAVDLSHFVEDELSTALKTMRISEELNTEKSQDIDLPSYQHEIVLSYGSPDIMITIDLPLSYKEALFLPLQQVKDTQTVWLYEQSDLFSIISSNFIPIETDLNIISVPLTDKSVPKNSIALAHFNFSPSAFIDQNMEPLLQPAKKITATEVIESDNLFSMTSDFTSIETNLDIISVPLTDKPVLENSIALAHFNFSPSALIDQNMEPLLQPAKKITATEVIESDNLFSMTSDFTSIETSLDIISIPLTDKPVPENSIALAHFNFSPSAFIDQNMEPLLQPAKKITATEVIESDNLFSMTSDFTPVDTNLDIISVPLTDKPVPENKIVLTDFDSPPTGFINKLKLLIDHEQFDYLSTAYIQSNSHWTFSNTIYKSDFFTHSFKEQLIELNLVDGFIFDALTAPQSLEYFFLEPDEIATDQCGDELPLLPQAQESAFVNALANEINPDILFSTDFAPIKPSSDKIEVESIFLDEIAYEYQLKAASNPLLIDTGIISIPYNSVYHIAYSTYIIDGYNHLLNLHDLLIGDYHTNLEVLDFMDN